MTKERPIPFSAPMVLAMLAGTKTQTRRVMKLKPWHQIEERDDGSPWPWMYDNDRDADHWLQCPYGKPGDQLWVREAWSTHSCFDDIPPRDLTTRSIAYEADGPITTGKLRPGMFMPRWASRITLEVTGVRADRLQNITRGDAMAEGCPFANMAAGPDPRDWYRDLWAAINGPDSWAANPWVWVIDFTLAKGATR
jgi:hypothetical protein